VPAGDAFSEKQAEDISRAIRLAEDNSGLHYSVYVGALEGEPRTHAQRLHAAVDDPASSVLVAVDPGGRRLEIVTGAEAERWLDDRSCWLAALSMTTQFGAGDLSGGIVNGLRTLSEHARHPRTLHTDTP
jgi:hypothetical protein